MRKVALTAVTSDMRLARPILGHRGELLLSAGMTLTPLRTRLLRDRGCFVVYIEDGLTDDIMIEETLSFEVRMQGVRAAEKLRDFMQNAAERMNLSNESSARESLESRDFARAIKNSRVVQELMDAASALVADVMNGDAALGLSSIRTYDSYTFDHSIDMAVAAVMIGKNIGLGEGDLRLLATGCMLHDTGKVFIDREILNKPGKLTPEEQDVMRQHAALGYEAVKQLFGPGVLSNHIPYQHHERQDGSGYPRGLVGTNTLPRPGERRDGKNILLLAEIASIADIYDALNSDRPYRPALPTDQILTLINSLSGTALNEALVDAFLKTMAPFPQGVEVELRGGPLDGFKAVVARVHRDNLPRPLVRVLYDPRNRRVEPTDLDLRAYPDVQLVPTIILPADEFGDQTSPLPYMEATLAAGRADLLRPDVC